MTRDLLTDAADEVAAAKRATTDPAVSDRLETLAGRLRSQAERETTPALGVLDRVGTKLRDIEADTDDPTVGDSLARARANILSFLDTLDDRGMAQHG
jgi:hypothetical protein